MTDASNQRHGVYITPVQQMFASCSGAILTSISMTPFDVVKIRLQAQKKPFMKGDCFLYCNGLMDHLCHCMNGQQSSTQWYKKPAYYNGTREALIGITRTEGLASLWSGLPPTLVMAVPATVVYFTCYEQMKVALNYHDADPRDWWKPMVAGASARIFAVTIISPIELVRTKLQSEQLTYSQLTRVIGNSIKTDGILSLWRGLVPTLLRDVPFSAIYWFGYESMKSYVLSTRGTTKLKFSESFAAGASAGTIAAILTLPFDVIKTHRQIEVGEAMTQAVTGKHASSSSSTLSLIVRLYRQQGIGALFTGFVPRVSKVAPACAIMISSYEYFKYFFRDLNEKKLQNVN